MKIGFITGITGQDGSYLAELLLSKGYIVWGIIRRCSNINTCRIDHIYENPNLILRYGDMSSYDNLLSVIMDIKNKYEDMERLEIYNLAAMSHVKISFELPEYTANVDGLGTLRLLDVIVKSGLKDKTRFYQASTSELYGKVYETPQNEKTRFYPRSPYAIAKLYAYWITINYREAYNLFACNGILFNHESERRSHNFITRKITRGLGMILKGERDTLIIGNLDAKRDWGYAPDYVMAIWLILQQDKPEDYVVSTNETHSVREFIEVAFGLKGFDIKWKNKGVKEIGYDKNTGKELIFVSEKYYRPTEVDLLKGDYSKISKMIGWKPKVTFSELVKIMVEHDCN